MIWMILSLLVASSANLGLDFLNSTTTQVSPTTAFWGNETQNATTFPAADQSLGADRLAFVVSYSVLMFVTIVGNCLVIAAFFKDPTLQAITNYWIVSLAMTDILLAALVMPLQVMKELHLDTWILGETMCDVFICLDVLCCTCSIYHLGLISLDRFLCVQFPIRYPAQRSRRKTLLAISITWMWCTLISMPRLLGWKDNLVDPNNCNMTETDYMIFSSLISFFLPLVLILAMYIGIYRVTRGRTLKLRRELAASVRVRDYLQAQKKNQRKHGPEEEHSAVLHSPSRLEIRPNVEEAISQCHESVERPGTSSDNSTINVSKIHKYSDKGAIPNSFTDREDEDSTDGITTEFPADSIPAAPYSFLNDRFRIKFHHPFHPLMVRFSKMSLSASIAESSPAGMAFRKRSLQRTGSVDSAPKQANRGILRLSHRRRTQQSSQVRLSKKRQKQENRTAKIVVIVLGAFVAFWSPFFLVNIIQPSCAACDMVWKIVVFWGYCNSAINPFIYTFFNRTFRRAIQSVLKCDRPRRFN